MFPLTRFTGRRVPAGAITGASDDAGSRRIGVGTCLGAQREDPGQGRSENAHFRSPVTLSAFALRHNGLSDIFHPCSAILV